MYDLSLQTTVAEILMSLVFSGLIELCICISDAISRYVNVRVVLTE